MLKTKRIGENMLTIANLSGGRDSTAMVIRYLELGNKIDYILFCDTGYEKEFELQNKQGLLFDENEYKEHETCFCGK